MVAALNSLITSSGEALTIIHMTGKCDTQFGKLRGWNYWREWYGLPLPALAFKGYGGTQGNVSRNLACV